MNPQKINKLLPYWAQANLPPGGQMMGQPQMQMRGGPQFRPN